MEQELTRWEKNREYNRHRAREYYKSKHPDAKPKKEYQKVLHTYKYKRCEARQLLDEMIDEKLVELE